MKHDYRRIYIELKKTGFFADLKTEATINGFYIRRNHSACMEPHGVRVTCSVPGYNRSRGKITVPDVCVVEFFNDGSAWIAQPGKLEDAITAIKTLTKKRKEEKKGV